MLSAELIVLFWFALLALVLDVVVLAALIVDYVVRLRFECPDIPVLPVARLLSQRQQEDRR